MPRLLNLIALLSLLLLVQACGGVSKDKDDDSGDNGDGGGNPPPDVGPFPPLERVVEVANGFLQGERVDGTDVILYQGIPYALPPVGDFRWREPQPAVDWTGVRDATVAGAACIQGNPLTSLVTVQDEDCLFLNVAAPEGETDSRRPVMVWFHDGDDDNGAATRPPTDIAGLAETTGNVIVSVNARLGFLGFLALPELRLESANNTTGNYRHLDEVKALQWLSDNIRTFNGNPNNVTLFGQFGGGNSVCRHLSSPLSSGLFHRVIMQSGTCGPAILDSLPVRYDQGDDFRTIWGCSSNTAPLDCMRQQSALDLRQALSSAGKGNDLLHNDLAAQAAFRPVAAIDDYAFNATPYEALTESPANIEVIIGVTRNQYTLFLQNDLNTNPDSQAAYQDAVKVALPGIGDPAVLTITDNLYPRRNYPSYSDAFADVMGDAIFACPAIATADVLADGGHSVRFYQFDREIDNAQLLPLVAPTDSNAPDMGVVHRAELSYLWNETALQVGSLPALTVAALRGYWGSFARTGVPSAEDEAEWPLYSTEGGEFLNIGVLVRSDVGYKLDKCDFLNSLNYSSTL